MVNTGFLPVPPDKGGSVELHTYYLSSELAKLGNEIHYVTSINPGVSVQKGVILHKLPWIPFAFHGDYVQTLTSFAVGGFFAFAKAVEAIDSSEYDVVHVHGHIPGIGLIPLKRKSTFVFTAHNPNPWMVRSFSQIKQAFRQVSFKCIELRIVKSFDCVIAVGECLKEELVHRFEINPGKINVIPNGVDTQFFRPNIVNSRDVLAKYHLPAEYVLFVGRLVEQKGLHFLLKAIKDTRIPVVVVGGGPLYSNLKELCRRLEIERQVHFVGGVPLADLRKLYSQANLFVIPSIAEGFPGGLVALEAMASGLPVIASRTHGIESVIHDGFNGFLFNVGDAEGLRSILVRLFDDVELAKRMGVYSRKIAEDQFSWSRIAEKTQVLYENLLRS